MKIMIVDDEKPIRQWFRFCIEKSSGDYQIVGEASNGLEALNAFEQSHPDLVITDIKMPVMDGFEFIKRLKARAPETDIVILTCYTEFALAREAIKLGAFDYIPKVEVQDQDILELLERLEQKRREQNSKNNGRKDIFLLLDSPKDGMSQEEINDKLLQAGMDLTNRTYAVFAVSLSQKLVELDDAFIKQTTIGDFLRIKSRLNQWWLLGIINQDLATWEKNQYIEKLQERLGCAVGMSQSYTNLDNLPKAFKEAFRAMEVCFFHGPSRLVKDNMQSKEVGNQFQDKIAELQKNLLQQVNQGNGTEILNCIASILEYLQNGSAEELRYLRLVCSEILAMLSARVRSAGNGHQIGELDLENLMEKGFFVDLQQGVLETSEKLVNLMVIPENNYSAVVKDTLRYIQEHCCEGISLHEVASNVHVNPNYLCQLFKNETGENFSFYLTELRLEKAKELLSSSDLKLYEIAEQVGYPNMSYFSRIFKKFTGKTPIDYRNSFRQLNISKKI